MIAVFCIHRGQLHNAVDRGHSSLIDALCQWNGTSYVDIADFGYNDTPGRSNSLAYFPGYPLLIRALVATGVMSAQLAAVMISNGLCVATAVIFALYIRDRLDGLGTLWAVAAFCFFPTAFFYHVAYSESLFVFLVAIFLMGVKKQKHPLYLAIISGCASAVRPVGVALVVPLCLYSWTRLSPGYSRVLALPVLAAMGLVGVAMFLGFQHFQFGNALGVVESQKLLAVCHPISTAEKCVRMLSWDPILAVYDPSSPAYWAKTCEVRPWWLNINHANPILFVFMSVLVFLGYWRRTLTANEIATASGLLFVPYLLRGYENAMISHGRFAAVCLPAYIVLGHTMQRRGVFIPIALLVLFATYFAIYSFQLGAGIKLL